MRAALAASVLLLSGGLCAAQSAVNLTAAPATAALPDGQAVPMWGYSCDKSQPASTTAGCAALNPSGGWSPVKITVPYTGAGTKLTINLTNALSFANGNTLPTSIVIAGQLGGGLGAKPTTVPSPQHAPLGVTWFASSPADTSASAVTVTNGGSGYSPTPTVTFSGGGTTTQATATATVQAGVITAIAISDPGSGYTSTPTVTINDATGHGAAATVSLAALQTGGNPTFTPPAQPDRVQSLATEVTVAGGTTTLSWNNLRPGTYLIQSGTQASIQVPMGLYGVLVVTAPGTAYTGVKYDADVAMVFSEIDPAQNQAVATAVGTAGFSASNVWSGQPGMCGDVGSPTSTASANTCFPPAVNYDPRYYLINGVSFDRTNIGASTQQILQAVAPATTTPVGNGTVLLRLVNAGLRMHVPAVVGKTMTLYAEDGNLLPGTPKVQSEVFLAAGKTYDVGIKPAASGGNYTPVTLPVYDRQLSLSTNNRRDGGMQAYIAIAGGATAGVGAAATDGTGSGTTAKAVADSYFLVAGHALTVTDPAKGVIANDTGVYGATVVKAPSGSGSTLVLNADGTFTYTPGAGITSDSFTYCGNGTTTGAACATVTLAACTSTNNCLGGAPTAVADSYTSTVATQFKLGAPGLLLNDTDPSGLPLTAVPGGSCTAAAGSACLPYCATPLPASPSNCVVLNADGSFKAYTPGPGNYQFTYLAQNSQGTQSAPATVSLTTPTQTGLKLNILGLLTPSVPNPSTALSTPTIAITDYRWIIEEDKTWYSDAACQINQPDPRYDSHGKLCPPLPVESLAYSFHTANMPVVATGCVGPISCESGQTLLGSPVACDVGDGQCRLTAAQKDALDPGQVALDPNKRYYISILPGDAINPTLNGQGAPVPKLDASGNPILDSSGNPVLRAFNLLLDCPSSNLAAWAAGTGLCGHGMGGAPIAAGQTSVTIGLQPTPLPTAQLAVFVYEDDNPLNGENDAGGGVDVLAPNEPGLGGFEVKVFDQAGGLGDFTGQITYDMFNMPVTNALAGTIDPITGHNACPITARPDRMVGMIPTCPKYEDDGVTLSPLAGQATINNMYPGLYEIVATPGADRIARGEEWLQTNTLDGGRAHEAFIKPNEPAYFQEFGPGGFHVQIGFANPKLINDRRTNTAGTGLCDPQKIDSSGNNVGGGGLTCGSSLEVDVSRTRIARTPDQRTYSSGDYKAYNWTQCYVSLGTPDGADFAFAKCDENGKVTFDNLPNGDWKIAVFDEWNDLTLDGLVNAVGVYCTTPGCDTTKPVHLKQDFPITQWRTNVYTRTFFDTVGDGVSHDDKDLGLATVAANIRYRDGSIGFKNTTDANGYAQFNEVFPFLNWLVVEADTTRFKSTATHTVYDTGGPVDGTSPNGVPCAGVACGNSTIAASLANTLEQYSLPKALRNPGSIYCPDADCSTASITKNSPYYGGTDSASFDPADTNFHSSGRIDPPLPWGTTQAWQGLLGQTSFIEFGMKPFKEGENGGIKGHVIYASTRPFDDPTLLLQAVWEPGVPHVQINLYQQGTAADGTTSLKLVDTTATTSWDDWAQGFRRNVDGSFVTYTDPKTGVTGYVPNMNCPGQSDSSPFFATLQGSKQFLDPDKKPLAANSQFKCFDGWAMLNQVQPAPYDGMYKFPSVTATDPATGRPAKSNCSICVANPDDGTPMLPAGTYVVEVIVPPGFELVKEEDKNILLGDIYIAPVQTQFTGLGAIFIMPDQAAVNSAYNSNNPLNQTTNLGSTTFPRHEGDTGTIESYWPCVGAKRIVPDFNSLFPAAQQNSPFAGALRPLCDRKLVTLQDQSAALAKFYVFTPAHIAAHFTGVITNDLASEFDPFSPQFGEKFAPPSLPVGMRDFSGLEINRVYADQWGAYDGLFTSTWEVNPPNPTGYGPNVGISCMNDPGPILDTRAGSPTNGQMITDPAYSPAYSNFCYEMAFMPGFTAYMDTPVVPVQSFADQYNLPDSEYPDGTPAIKSVVNSNAAAPQGPWASTGSGATTPASLTLVVSGVLRTGSISAVTVNTTPATSLIAGPIQCVGCNALNQTLRNDEIAALLFAAINLNSAATGYSASYSLTTPDHLTIVGPASAGAGLNGASISFTDTGVTVSAASPSTTLAFSGGSTASGTNYPNLTITALGDKVVINPAYSGPAATTAPYNQKSITRHYGFGATQGTGTVTIGGVNAAVTSWSDSVITVTVPNNVPLCSAGNPTYTGANASAQCGELVITANNGKSSIDAITVTINGSTPKTVTTTIQAAIDAASPGDLIIVPPGTYKEHVLMWKPVRLQGVGAASVTINADAHPVGVMDTWRRQVDCLFGLQINGVPSNSNSLGTSPPVNNFDPAGVYTCPDNQFLRADRIPFEAIIGWDSSGNGNLAQVLQEPTLMGAYEGAGITVLGRGVKAPAPTAANIAAGQFPYDFWGQSATGGAGAFTDGSTWLTAADCSVPAPAASSSATIGRDYVSSNYYCNPSRIDGVSVINSSQGGGGVFIHGWAQYLEVSNNHITANQGTLSGAINLGNGETPDAFVNDGVECGTALTGANAVMPCPPIPAGTVLNAAIPFQFNTHVHIHHNAIVNNASIGDALFSGTPAGSGGVTISAGSDYYQVDHNWIAGNLTSSDGAGIQHVGLSFGGQITNNFVLFNQSTNPTLPTNGGGIAIMGANVDRTVNGNECGSTNDVDCTPGIGEGAGGGLVVDSNLIVGNSAEGGSGGGLRIQQVNGTEVATFSSTPANWYDVKVTNNVITNNVAGWDGAGISLEDTLKATIVNNTIVANDTTASAGVLFKTLGAATASSPPPGCDPAGITGPLCGVGGNAAHNPQPAGLVVAKNTPNMVASLTGLNVTCPAGYGYTGGNCSVLSLPNLTNNILWQNRAFHVEITGLGTALQSQQNLVALIPALNQTSTGYCASSGLATDGTTTISTAYWDAGVRDDKIPNDGAGAGVVLSFSHSILTPTGARPAYNGTGNLYPSASPVLAQYCNGSRIPPENGGKGYNAPAGRSETTGLGTVFVFNNITPAATVDEGNNWINLTYGPLTLSKPAETSSSAAELMVATPAVGLASGAYSIGVGSPAVGAGVSVAGVTNDFFGRTRSATGTSIGAVELIPPTPTVTSINPASGSLGAVVAVTLTGTNFTEDATLTVSGTGVTVSNLTWVSTTQLTATFTIAANATVSIRTVTVTTPGGTATTSFAVTKPPAPTITGITPASGFQGTTVPVTISGTNLTGATLSISGNTGNNSTFVTFTGVAATATSITANVVIPTTAAATVRTITVTTAGGTASTTFTVQAPKLTSISPNSGERGATATTVNVTLNGTGFAGTPTVNLSGLGLAVSNVVVVSDKQITATFTIAGAANPGAHNVSVTTSGVTTGTVPFTVTGATANLAVPPTSGTGSMNTGGTGTKTGTVTVSNTASLGTGGPLTFTAAPTIAKVSGAGTFSIIAGGTCTAATVLNPGATCTIAVQYAPGTSTATATANVTITATGLATATLTSNIFQAN